jgi:HCOMODA/2-hydroxy-3-carboxy-muconic semialdehyde decarboxylase
MMLITPAADLARVTVADLVEVELSAASLPPGAPAETWAHLAVYLARPDVAAVARAQPPAAFAAASALSDNAQAGGRRPPVTVPVLPLLHGQACWLGTRVPVHQDARLLRSGELAAAAASALGSSDAVILRGNGALTCGASPGLAAARMWLLAAACETWLAAAACGTPRPMGAAEAESWRAVAGELLPRLWLHLGRKAGNNDATADGG